MARPLFFLIIAGVTGATWFPGGNSPTCAALEPSDFEADERFQVTSAVLPGLVKHPMMASFDDRGRLFVADSSGTNYNKSELLEKTPHSVVLLADSDGDGVFDQSSVFADKMTFPQGALWIYDGLYVMSPPGMWYLEDADGDGTAEKRELLVTGFDFTGNAADVHGPFLHPNGRLYWCHGRKGHEVRDPKTDLLVSQAKGARIWSCQLDGGDVRVHAGGGMDNPVEIDFTDTGEIIGSVNLFYGRPRGDVLVHWLHGGVYPRFDQEKVLAEFPRTGPILREVHNFGHVAVSGMCRYRSGHLDADWKDQWLVAHFNSNQVTRTRLAESGSSFKAEETEPVFQLMRPNAHLTDVLEDPNGDLLVIDTGGWFRNGCPNSQLARPDVRGGIYRISLKGKPYRSAAGSRTREQWERLSPIDVAEMLDAKSWNLQERAVTELAVRGHSAIPELRGILESKASSATAKRNAVWALARMRFSDSPDLLHLALQDKDRSVQIAACNAISVTRTWQSIASNNPNEMKHELERNKKIAETLAKLVRAAPPEVARNAAVAIGTMAEARAIGSLMGRIGRIGDGDDALRHALTFALIETGEIETVAEALQSGNPKQQAAALWALQSIGGENLEVLDVLPFLESGSALLEESVVEIAKQHPEWDAAIINRFYEFTEDLTPRRAELILELAPAYRGSPPLVGLVTDLLANENPESVKIAQKLIPRLGSYRFPDAWEESVRKWLKDPNYQSVALECLRETDATRFKAEIKAIAEDESLPAILRVQAIRAASKKGLLSAEAFDLIKEILKTGKDLETRSGAVEILTGARLNVAQRTETATLLRHADPVELGRLFKIFRRLDHEPQARALSESLIASPGFASLNMAEVRGKFTGFDEEIRQPIDEAIAKASLERSQRKDKVKALVEDLDLGDPSRGREHFSAGKGACITCHKVGETGRAVGPDLTKLAGIRTPLDFFESILYPGESIARDFDCFFVEKKDGSQLAGLIQQETQREIFLTELSGEVRQIDRSEIVSIQRNPNSLMPQGLEQTMTRQELLDLVSYLMTLK